MFEALFILTTIDAGTRVGRFLAPGFARPHLAAAGQHARVGRESFCERRCSSSAWGWFLYQGVLDPLGGINSLWPLFGLANQLLSVIALCLGTTILIKMGKARYLWTTLVPLVFMIVVTFSAGYLKIFSADPRIGFLSGAQALEQKIAAQVANTDFARQAGIYRLNALVAAAFLVLVLLIVGGCAREWWKLLRGTKPVRLHESEFVPLAEIGAPTR